MYVNHLFFNHLFPEKGYLQSTIILCQHDHAHLQQSSLSCTIHGTWMCLEACSLWGLQCLGTVKDPEGFET